MTAYPFATLREEDIRQLQEERLHELEVALVRNLLKQREVPDDHLLKEQHGDLIGRLEIHRADLALPSALTRVEEVGPDVKGDMDAEGAESSTKKVDDEEDALSLADSGQLSTDR